MLRAARPIEAVLADPDTEAKVRDALLLVEPTLAFARTLGLDVGRQYRSYASWPGDRVVTALVATRPGEIDPAGFWFPIVGRQPYKGFFVPARAEREAARLHERGLDTCLVPVPAYSTLGWLADPVTTPLLRSGTGRFVETLLHELVHATVFLAGDAAFNEGVATFIGQEGAIRFFAAHDGEAAAGEERVRVADERAIARELAALRAQVAALYRDHLPAPERTARRAALSEATRSALGALPLTRFDAKAVAAAARLGDACLALAATYAADLDAYAGRLARLDGDLAGFVGVVRAAADEAAPREALGLPPRDGETTGEP